MSRPTIAAALCGLLIASASACSDGNITPSVPAGPDFTTYVAVGNSVSMGWANDGVVASSQRDAWPRLLATAANASISLPLISAPGCSPTYAAPLASFSRVDGSSVASTSKVCAPLEAGAVVSRGNLAIEGATAVSALTETPEKPLAGRDRPDVVSRVLAPGQTQVSAMRALKPTFVTVDLGGNEILPAQIGVLAPNVTFTPFATFQAAYASIIDSIKATGAKALLMSLATDIRQFPTIRTGPEIASQRAAFAAFHVTVDADCDNSPNFIFVRGKVPTAVATGAARAAAKVGPAVLSCADVPGTPDFILSPGDISFINNLLSQMNTEIAARATANGYALSSLESLYAPSKNGVPFDLRAYLTSATPYGATISLDGVHPTAQGQRILAAAAIKAINEKYSASLTPIVP